MVAAAQGDDRLPFIVETGVLGTASVVMLACYVRSLWLEYAYRRAKHQQTNANSANTSAKEKEAERDFPWYCRRLGLVAGVVQCVWSVDVHASLGWLDMQLSSLLPPTELALYLGALSVWVITHARAHYRQAKADVPPHLIRLMKVLPFTYVIPGWALAILAHQRDDNLYQTVYSWVFALTLVSYMAIILFYYFHLRAALWRFVAQAQQPALNAAAAAAAAAAATTTPVAADAKTNGGAAVVSIAIKPAAAADGTASSPVNGAVAKPKPAAAAPPSTFQLDTSHLTGALRQLRVFVSFLLPLGLIMVGFLLFAGIYGFTSGNAFHKGELPPPSTFGDAIPFLILDLVAWGSAATICWYSWPKALAATRHGAGGKTGPESVTTRPDAESRKHNATVKAAAAGAGGVTRPTASPVHGAARPKPAGTAGAVYVVANTSPKLVATTSGGGTPTNKVAAAALNVAADVPLLPPASGNGWVQPSS